MDQQTLTLSPAAVGLGTPPGLTVTIVGADGIRQATNLADLRSLVAANKFFWIDIVGSNEASRAAYLDELGLEAGDLAWVQRFGQTGRMVIGRKRLRAVTWLSERLGAGFTEVHVLGSHTSVATVWDGDPRVLGEIREHFAERAAELEKSPAAAASILLQLLLGTLHNRVGEVDEQIQKLRTQLREAPRSIDFATLTTRVQRLQSAWSDIDRYSSTVRMAIVGVEALPGIDPLGVAELNDYADQVEDLEHRLQERTRWGADILQDYATAIAQRQGEQISRLTMVSLIFLPITFLTGFFGMNFNWMIDSLASPLAFGLLGILLPVVSVGLTVAWLKRRGLI